MRCTDDLNPESLGERTEDLRTGDCQSRRRRVTRCELAKFQGGSLESGGRGEDEHSGWLDVDRECVRDPAWGEYEGPTSRFEFLVADVERHLTVEDEPGFVLVVTDVERRLGTPNVTIEGARVRENLHAHVALSPSTFDRLDDGSSCTKAAVFFRNIGISGTCSIVINSVASF
jgi:hypothetical protein